MTMTTKETSTDTIPETRMKRLEAIEQTAVDTLRTNAWNVLKTFDEVEAMLDGSFKQILIEPTFNKLLANFLIVFDEYGLLFCVPLFIEVEDEYRKQKPNTKIPPDAFGTLIGFYEDEYADEETPLTKCETWQYALAVMTLPPKLAKRIQELPYKMAEHIRHTKRTNIIGAECETMLFDLIDTICDNDKECPKVSTAFSAEHRIIVIEWSIADVQDVRPDLTGDESWQVLQHVERHHDASIGIKWDTIEDAAETLFPVESKE